MAWSWSHTAEAYRDAELNLRELPRDKLVVIWAEWESQCVGHTDDSDGTEPGFCESCYEKALKRARTIDNETLSDSIWSRASEQATCTNGGWEAWLCPYGCGCHVVPFNRDDDTE